MLGMPTGRHALAALSLTGRLLWRRQRAGQQQSIAGQRPAHLLQPVVVAEEREVLDGQVAQRAHERRLPRARSGATTPGTLHMRLLHHWCIGTSRVMTRRSVHGPQRLESRL